MAIYVEGVDRGQASLFPDRLEDFVGENNPVRVARSALSSPIGSAERQPRRFLQPAAAGEPQM